jgi:hypothetical protein
MRISLCRSKKTTRRHLPERAGLLVAIGLFCRLVSFAQGPAENLSAPVTNPNPKPAPSAVPVTADERAELLKLIKGLQDRLEKLEAAQSTSSKTILAVKTLTTFHISPKSIQNCSALQS